MNVILQMYHLALEFDGEERTIYSSGNHQITILKSINNYDPYVQPCIVSLIRNNVCVIRLEYGTHPTKYNRLDYQHEKQKTFYGTLNGKNPQKITGIHYIDTPYGSAEFLELDLSSEEQVFQYSTIYDLSTVIPLLKVVQRLEEISMGKNIRVLGNGSVDFSLPGLEF